MEYGNDGHLRQYLKKHFDSMNWNQKLKLALEIANGVSYLHKEEILHRDLVSILMK